MANTNEKATFDAAAKSEAFFEKNRKLFIGIIAAIVIVIAGWFCYNQFIGGPREEKASTAIAQGQDYFNQEMYDKALNGDGAGYAGFVKIASDYSSTDAGNLANLYAGLCYYYQNKYTEAVKYLEQFSPKGDAMVSPAAIAALGNAYAAAGQVDKAISKLKDAADKCDSRAKGGVDNSFSPQFLVQAGELLESQNKTDEANKLYQDIKKKYVNAPVVQSNEIDKYIERTTK